MVAKATCSVLDCGRPVKGRGWCANHYAQHFRAGTLDQADIKQQVVLPCSMNDCPNPAKSRGLCVSHYKRWWRNGDAEGLKRIHQPRGASLREVFEFYMPGDPPPEGVVWPWTGDVTATGYGRLRYNYRRLLAHRVAYELFIGPIAPGRIIRHKNDTPIDVNPNNLEPGTHWDNTNDRRVRGRSKPGEQHHMHKLTDEQVREIRHKRNQEGQLLRILSADYGISIATVSSIARRKIWQHLPD